MIEVRQGIRLGPASGFSGLWSGDGSAGWRLARIPWLAFVNIRSNSVIFAHSRKKFMSSIGAKADLISIELNRIKPDSTDFTLLF